MMRDVVLGARSSNNRSVKSPVKFAPVLSRPDTFKRMLRPPDTTSAVTFELLDEAVYVMGLAVVLFASIRCTAACPP